MTEGAFTKKMKEKITPTGILIILLIIAWVCGYVWRGIYA